MQIVMDFDGVFTDPTEEGELCKRFFRERIEQTGILSNDQIDTWFGELRARMASRSTEFGWRSQGRISAFSFEDPFIRAIGFADFLDHLAGEGDEKANQILKKIKTEGIESFGALSEWAFHQLRVVKRADRETLEWVKKQHGLGHQITVVSNSAPEKIEDFLKQNLMDPGIHVQVRGNAKKFELGAKPKTIEMGEYKFDVNRPGYEAALIELQPDLVIGDVFSLDLALPISLKREGKIPLRQGVVYRIRNYSPKPLVDLFTQKPTKPEDLRVIETWARLVL
jgi:FMN phosphatase YigB (HAD superfamily)